MTVTGDEGGANPLSPINPQTEVEMRDESDIFLCDRYPSLFRQKPFGFEVAEGWFFLVDSLCDQIVETGLDVWIFRVKEKFGALEVELNGDDRYHPSIDRIRDSVKEQSQSVCEECAEPAITSEIHGWLSTRCKLHSKQLRQEA